MVLSDVCGQTFLGTGSKITKKCISIFQLNMPKEINVLRDVSQKLLGAGIQYMLTGSLALSYYAEPRMTRDIDIVIQVGKKDTDRLIELFEGDYYLPRNAATRAIASETLFNVIHTREIVKVDLIIRKSSDYRRLEFERRREVKVEGVPIWIVSKEDLIISKLLWAKDSHSQLQLKDVKNLLKSGYDDAYLKEWTERLGLNDLLKEASA